MTTLRNAIFILFTLIISGCAMGPSAPPVTPERLAHMEPVPRQDNLGEFISPITSDGVTAEWVAAAINASMGASIGATVGAFAGEKLMEQIPFVGGFLGSTLGKEVGRKIAIESAGGWDVIRDTSDLSFDNLRDLSLYLYINYGNNENFADVLSAISGIYPDLEQQFWVFIQQANIEVWQQEELNQPAAING